MKKGEEEEEEVENEEEKESSLQVEQVECYLQKVKMKSKKLFRLEVDI